jgi:hypothetical protein
LEAGAAADIHELAEVDGIVDKGEQLWVWRSALGEKASRPH